MCSTSAVTSPYHCVAAAARKEDRAQHRVEHAAGEGERAQHHGDHEPGDGEHGRQRGVVGERRVLGDEGDAEAEREAARGLRQQGCRRGDAEGHLAVGRREGVVAPVVVGRYLEGPEEADEAEREQTWKSKPGLSIFSSSALFYPSTIASMP